MLWLDFGGKHRTCSRDKAKYVSWPQALAVAGDDPVQQANIPDRTVTMQMQVSGTPRVRAVRLQVMKDSGGGVHCSWTFCCA